METQFSYYLIKILEAEKMVELLRQNLAKIIHFSPYSVFKFLDKSNKGFININDFKRFFLNTAINFTDRNLAYLFRYFDRDRDNIINYNEFLKIVLPQNDNELRSIASQRSPQIVMFLNYLVEQALVRLFEKELNSVETFYQYSLDVKSTINFSLNKLFTVIDYFRNNCIDANGLEYFLKLNGYYLSATELKSIIFRLDKDEDGRISLAEFQDIFYLNDSSYRISEERPFTQSNNMIFENRLSKMTNSNHILRRSMNDIDLKASMRTYTSPQRIRTVNFSQDLRTLSPNVRMQSLEGKTSLMRNSINASQNFESLSLRNSYTFENKSNRLTSSLRNYPSNPYSKSDFFSRSYKNIDNTRSSTLKSSSQMEDLNYYLIKYLKDIIELELNLESNKEKFCLQSDMTINHLYKIFDNEFFGSFGMLQMKESLLGIDVLVNIDDVKLLFKRYNSTSSGRFSYNDFSEMIIPKKYEYSKLIQSRYIPSSSSLSYETRFKFTNLLKGILENEKNVELYKKLLNANVFFNSIQAFNLIKPKYKDYFTLNDVLNFFKVNSCIVLEAEAELLLRRFDKNRDGKVRYEEVRITHKLVSSRNSFLNSY